MTAVTFHFDPICPWTWLTSRWLVGVADRQGVAVEWRSLSLAYANRDKEVPEQFRPRLSTSTAAHRVIQALRADGDNEAIGRFYAALGTRVHRKGEDVTPAAVEAAGIDVGLSDAIRAAATDASLDAAAAADTEAALGVVGSDVGSPVLLTGDGVGFFGPIIDAVPSPEDGDRLWAAISSTAPIFELKELKRARRREPAVESS